MTGTNENARRQPGARDLVKKINPACNSKPRSLAAQARVHRIPSNNADHWSNKIADMGSYYRQLFQSAKPNGEGYALVKCCFHQDRTPSLSICFDHGGWRCYAGCGSGDLVSFVMRREGCGFQTALEILGAR